MYKPGWICVVIKDGKFDSILEGLVYASEAECNDAIASALLEDIENDWEYEYCPPRIVSYLA